MVILLLLFKVPECSLSLLIAIDSSWKDLMNILNSQCTVHILDYPWGLLLFLVWERRITGSIPEDIEEVLEFLKHVFYFGLRVASDIL
jgi:hypothetical protein